MFIFLTNTPREYAWGSTQMLSDWLGVPNTGKPQAELWLGAHPGAPASVAKASPDAYTLIDLIATDPENYGVAGGSLPFLLKVLAIAKPLSLQVHPNLEQAQEGFAREESAKLLGTNKPRNYGDPNHKPELLVALTEVTALCGFRDIDDVRADLLVLAGIAELHGDDSDSESLKAVSRSLLSEPQLARQTVMSWLLEASPEAVAAHHALVRLVQHSPDALEAVGELRAESLTALVRSYPDDQALIVSLLMNVVRLLPGQGMFLGAQQLHAYLSGLGVEIMAASDNVLRAGFTEKYVDVSELKQVLDYSVLDDPVFPYRVVAPGVLSWDPPVADFRLLRATLDPESTHVADLSGPVTIAAGPDAMRTVRRAVNGAKSASELLFSAEAPVLALVTQGRVRVTRRAAELSEVSVVKKGQCLFISAGAPVKFSGAGEVFLGTVGTRWSDPQVCREDSTET